MRTHQRLLAMLVTFLLLVSSFPPSMFAEEVNDPYDGIINIQSEWPWAFSAFGGNTTPAKNPEPVAQDQTSVTMTTYGGKISSSDEGLSFYYKEIPVDANFELKAKATVTSFNSNSSVSTPNQKSFGLMLRDTIGINGDSSTITSNYVAVGALDQVMKGFYKKQHKQSSLHLALSTPLLRVKPMISA